MRDAFFFGYYRSYPHQAEVRIGPLPATAANADETTRGVMAEMRPTCHAVIVMPRKVLLIRFARRATGQDVERLEHERDLLRQTPELAAVLHWPIEARLVHCDIADGVKELARARGVRRRCTGRDGSPHSGRATCRHRLTASWCGGSTLSDWRNMRLLTLARSNGLPTLPNERAPGRHTAGSRLSNSA